jgi:hypothetical protein
MRALLPFLAVALAAPSALAQTTIYTLPGPKKGDQAGRSVAVLPDRDGDGHDELLVGAPGDTTAAPRAGALRVVSGANGVTSATVFGDGAEDLLGWAVAAAGDVDADGVVDVIAGAPSECGTGEIGYARVYSGADLATLHTVAGDTFLDMFGAAVSGAGDQDLDGHADFAVGAYSFCAGFELKGFVRAYSGADGSQRWQQDGDSVWDSFGWSVAELGDFDLDGVPDLIAGAPGNDAAGYDAGRFTLLSGVDGAKIYQEDGEAGLHYSGFAVAGTGDFDLDGVLDYAIGVPGEQDGFGPSPHPAEFGKLELHSGATHSVAFDRYGAAALDHLGWAVATAGDLDLDGHADVAAAATRYDVQTTKLSLGPAYIEVLSGASGDVLLHLEGPVTAENHEVDLASGSDVNGDGTPDFLLGSNGASLTAGFACVLSGRELELSSASHLIGQGKSSQDLSIDTGGLYEGQIYRVLGSVSGTDEGFSLAGMHVPLNLDFYTLFTLNPPSGSLLKHAQGIIGEGKPLATFKPSTEQQLVLLGITVHHALVIFEDSGAAACVSAAVPVTIVP